MIDAARRRLYNSLADEAWPTSEASNAMADPFEFWRLLWTSAISRGLESLSEAVPGEAVLDLGRRAGSVDLSALTTLGHIRLELATMLLVERNAQVPRTANPVLIVAPYAVHEASIADFADRHSLAQVLVEGGSERLALTYWKSATAEMRDYGIDAYLSDLNVAVDDLGGRASLVGLCQGGWLAAAYAARFPHKVSKLVLAGAPVDPGAAESRITKILFSVSTASIAQALALSGGRVLGSLAYALWSEDLLQGFAAEPALQCADNAALIAKFDAWNAKTVDLPGRYFLQTAEWIFRENRLARGSFPVLGREIGLSNVTAPMYILAAADDEIVAVKQATAEATLRPRGDVKIRIEPGRHLSLFMGRRTLNTAWREIAHWLRQPDAGGLPKRGTQVEACDRGGETSLAGSGARKARPQSIVKPSRKRRPSGLMRVTHIAEDFDLPDESIIRDFEGSH
jgi:poly(3-hydroxyalkanoate) synthetase